MQSLDKEEILLMIEQAEALTISNTHRYLITAIMVTILTICCQGG